MTQLDDLLNQWGRGRRLTPAQSDAIRTAVVREASADDDWLRDLLRPVSALLDGPNNLYDTLTKGLTHA